MNTTVMNATASGLTGITNLASQSGTIGTIFGSVVVIGLILSVFVGSHSWNTKGWLYKLVKFLLKNVGENVLVGVASCSVVGGIYYVGSELSKFGEANPRFLYDVALFCGEAVVAVAIFALIGFFTKPVWNFVIDYASGKKKRVVKA
jgi:uncharacterized membrane protein